MGKDKEIKDNEPKSKELVIDTQSPYFLHPSDSLEMNVTIVKFNEKTYDPWEQAIRIALKAKNKLAFIDEKLTKPVIKDGVYLAKAIVWKMVNSMIISWIMNVIDPKLHWSTTYVDSVEKMWENIWKRYSILNVPVVHQLKVEIASSK